MKRTPRPRDPIQLGKLMVDIATGAVPDAVEEGGGYALEKKLGERVHNRLNYGVGLTTGYQCGPLRTHCLPKRICATHKPIGSYFTPIVMISERHSGGAFVLYNGHITGNPDPYIFETSCL